MIDQVIAGYSVEPGGEFRLIRVIGLEGSKDLNKNLLGQILGFLIPTGATVAQIVNLVGMSVQQRLPGRIISFETEGDGKPRSGGWAAPRIPNSRRC